MTRVFIKVYADCVCSNEGIGDNRDREGELQRKTHIYESNPKLQRLTKPSSIIRSSLAINTKTYQLLDCWRKHADTCRKESFFILIRHKRFYGKSILISLRMKAKQICVTVANKRRLKRKMCCSSHHQSLLGRFSIRYLFIEILDTQSFSSCLYTDTQSQ